jgi:hypothetical protein
MTLSQITEFSILLVNWTINITEYCFSVQHDQEGNIHYAYGAGEHAGLTVVLDTQQPQYFAPLQPMIGIWVSHIQAVIPSSVK